MEEPAPAPKAQEESISEQSAPEATTADEIKPSEERVAFKENPQENSTTEQPSKVDHTEEAAAPISKPMAILSKVLSMAGGGRKEEEAVGA